MQGGKAAAVSFRPVQTVQFLSSLVESINRPNEGTGLANPTDSAEGRMAQAPVRMFAERLKASLRTDPADAVRLLMDGVSHDLVPDQPDLAALAHKGDRANRNAATGSRIRPDGVLLLQAGAGAPVASAMVGAITATGRSANAALAWAWPRATFARATAG